MNHPIASERITFKLYTIAWIILALIHSAILYWSYQIPVVPALIDGLVFNTLMYFLGLSIWFPVLYIDTQKSWINTLAQLLTSGIVLVAFWLFAGKLLVGLFVDEAIQEQLFALKKMTTRGIVGGLLFILYVLIYYMLMFYTEIQKRASQQETMNRLLRETELKALKAQLNPHFLFNSLNSISSLTITDPDAAREMINKLSDFLRYSLKKNENTLLPLREELKNMSRYLEIEKVRFGDRLLCESSVPATCKDLQLPVLILQPLYENAVKHGVYESIEPVTIRTFCRCVENELEISVINNYDEDSKSHKGEGIGLENIVNRLKNIYHRDDLVTISRENGHFEVAVRIPQNQPNAFQPLVGTN